MNGNHNQNNDRMRRPAPPRVPDQSGRPAPNGRPQVKRPQNGRPQSQNPPLRPQQRRGESMQKRPAPVGRPAPAPDKKMGRNFILAAVLFFLVLALIVIFGVQSCSHNDDDEYSGNDDVILNTPQNSPLKHYFDYADYTEDSKTLKITSEYGILIDLDSNTVIASKNGDDRIYPASMTKVMTLIVAYENIKDLDAATYTFDAELLNDMYLAGASVAGFSVGETVTARDLLYGSILPSGGDATNALAELVAGDEEHFAVLMNEKVKDLGLKGTHFVTASGLHDDDHYSTCHDMAIILKYAIANPEMRKILSTYQYTTSKTEQHPDGITLTSTLYQRMAGDEVEGLYVQGGKTGYTNEAKNCLCTFAANCREDESASTLPQYILVTAYGVGEKSEYVPVFDAIDSYKKYCAD